MKHRRLHTFIGIAIVLLTTIYVVMLLFHGLPRKAWIAYILAIALLECLSFMAGCIATLERTARKYQEKRVHAVQR
jgi:cell division protein FtsW (lipid II flippase)